MFSKKAIRIISIVLAALMILSVGVAAIQVFAADENAIVLAAVNTGDNDGDYIIPAVLIAVAVIAVGVCLVLPKLKKKEKDD